MNYATKNLALQMESCIKQTHIEVTKQYANGQILELNGGALCFSGFDSYLSQVVAWGFSTKPKHYGVELQIIEEFYRRLNHNRVDIEFCPYIGNSLAQFLSERGYQVMELNNVSFLDLEAYKPVVLPFSPFLVRPIGLEELDEWAGRMAEGFEYPEAKEQFFHYARAKHALSFAAYDKNNIIAGGSIAMHGKVCDLGVTSTLSPYRGLGLQKKILYARLNHAKEQGLSLATVTTEPGSISNLNIQKVGFSCAYTRIKFTKLAL